MCCSINFQISNEAATFWKRAFHETLSKRLSKFNNRIPVDPFEEIIGGKEEYK